MEEEGIGGGKKFPFIFIFLALIPTRMLEFYYDPYKLRVLYLY